MSSLLGTPRTTIRVRSTVFGLLVFRTTAVRPSPIRVSDGMILLIPIGIVAPDPPQIAKAWYSKSPCLRTPAA